MKKMSANRYGGGDHGLRGRVRFECKFFCSYDHKQILPWISWYVNRKKRFTKVKNLYYKLTKGLNELTPPCSICRLMRSVSFYLLSECIFTGDLCIHECCIVKLYVQIKGPKLFS